MRYRVIIQYMDRMAGNQVRSINSPSLHLSFLPTGKLSASLLQFLGFVILVLWIKTGLPASQARALH